MIMKKTILALDIRPGDGMYVAPAERPYVW